MDLSYKKNWNVIILLKNVNTLLPKDLIKFTLIKKPEQSEAIKKVMVKVWFIPQEFLVWWHWHYTYDPEISGSILLMSNKAKFYFIFLQDCLMTHVGRSETKASWPAQIYQVGNDRLSWSSTKMFLYWLINIISIWTCTL